MALVAQVVLQNAAPQYDKPYDYLVGELSVSAGCRVTVPFGRSNAGRLGMVLSVTEGDATGKKQIKQCIDAEPLLSSEGLLLVSRLRESTFCSWYDAVACQIPPGAGVKLAVGLTVVPGLDAELLSSDAQRLYAHLLTKKRLCDRTVALAEAGLTLYSPAAEELLQQGFATAEQLVKKKIADKRTVMARLVGEAEAATEKQQRVLDLLAQFETLSVSELCYFAAVTKSVVETLVKKGVVELYEQLTPPAIPEDAEPAQNQSPIQLSGEQQKAFDQILPTLGTSRTTLLYGVTGSGKTQVFLRLIQETIARGRQAIVLIPEISLTDQTIARFAERFGSRAVLLHSSLSVGERQRQFARIRRGDCDVVVGTRLAIFAPLERLGLIVIDEEQEHTYHSEMPPKYHAKSVAQWRARHHNCPVLLCSATPSVESYYKATTDSYNLAIINERYSKNALPDVTIIDMAAAPAATDAPVFSQQLCEELLYNLAHQEQSILLLNRRGYSTRLRCSSCAEIVKCPHCSVAMTYHAKNGKLCCHSCGHITDEPTRCPICQSAMLRYAGYGTQQAEEQLKKLLPDARILRMDADTTLSRTAYARGFSAFAKGEYDIMLGTQMVAKGLDFPRVTLVGVLAADQSLYAEDFRGYERTFSLITQAVGRCGRADLAGRAIIQTYSPENAVLRLAAKQDYPAFFAEEIAFRRVALYPPFCDFVSIQLSSEQEQEAITFADGFAAFFYKTAKEQYPGLALRLLGPAEDTPYRVAGRYRVRLLLKCRHSRPLLELLWQCHAAHYRQSSPCRLSIDLFYE